MTVSKIPTLFVYTKLTGGMKTSIRITVVPMNRQRLNTTAYIFISSTSVYVDTTMTAVMILVTYIAGIMYTVSFNPLICTFRIEIAKTRATI